MGKETENHFQPQNTLFQKVEEKVLTEPNKKRVKKICRVAGIVLLVLLAVDFLSMIIYFSIYGIPK